MTNRSDDSRYPHTYAADYLREKVGDDYGKGLMSRAAASVARDVMAKALGLNPETVANLMADAYLREREQEVNERLCDTHSHN